MTKMIFVSLPVADLRASITFYKALGFDQNLHFSDDASDLAPEKRPPC
jgi:predicted lactoylglutathione lyase